MQVEPYKSEILPYWKVLPREEDSINAQFARIFYQKWQLVKTDPEYVRLADRHRNQYERPEIAAARSPGS